MSARQARSLLRPECPGAGGLVPAGSQCTGAIRPAVTPQGGDRNGAVAAAGRVTWKEHASKCLAPFLNSLRSKAMEDSCCLSAAQRLPTGNWKK